MPIPGRLAKLLIRWGIAQRLPAVRRLVGDGLPFLKYYSRRVLDSPNVELRQTQQLLDQPAARCFDLSLGAPELQPGLLTPAVVERALVSGYPPVGGLPELCRAIAEKLAVDNQLFCDPHHEILVCNGVTQGIALMLDTFVDPGERVVIADPAFFIYRLAAQNRGAKVVRLHTWVDDGRTQFDERTLRRVLRGARLVYLNSPANPTGGVLDYAAQERIAWWCKRFDVLIFSDEVYERFQYEGRHHSPASLPEARLRTITANGFSKSHGMAGQRVAYLAGPRALIQPLLVSQLASAPFVSVVGQQMALEALRQPAGSFEPILRDYLARRELVAERLSRHRLAVSLPAGAFYFWVPVWQLGWTGEAFAGELLRTSEVRLLSGANCGPSGQGYVRLSYTGRWHDLVEGLDRLEGFLTDGVSSACRENLERRRKSA